MSVRLPIRALAAVTPRVPVLVAPSARNISFFGWGKKDKDKAADAPLLSSERNLDALLKSSPRTQRPSYSPGSLKGSTIFEEEGPEDESAAMTTDQVNYGHLRSLRDPRHDVWSFGRTHEARTHRRRGRLTRREKILQEEKSHTLKSPFWDTSVKKLGPLARQIAGKKIEDAIVQMQFSPKKAAKEVLKHLQLARDEAIVRHDMRPETMYVSEAWVGRGEYGHALNHKARGRIDQLWLPKTQITVVLKETKTLERIKKEKDAKRLRKAVQHILPSRPITGNGQRQYYLW
ncbi:ribosomal protein L22 [Ascodesmis nigricans]|uniref:Ribosomal protein L22 n=1 Tax=Ascodesmis nigricans TaxID=341454 RepID=A0A4S2N793_9PEZI|nr:ribosomal protein L22 [Ascodesmis nigricans]